MKERLLAGAALGLLVLSGWLVYSTMYSPVTTVIVVRHAERLNGTDTTSLSAEGRERAAALSTVIRDAGVGRIFVTDRVRTAQTAAPTAERLNIVPTVVPEKNTALLLDSLHACRGEVILLVGHANTIPAILRGLDVHGPVAVLRDVYDDLFVVTVSPFRSALARLKYGRPS